MNKSIGGFVVIILGFVLIVNGNLNIGGAALTVWRFFSGGVNAAIGDGSQTIIINNPGQTPTAQPQNGYRVP